MGRLSLNRIKSLNWLPNWSQVGLIFSAISLLFVFQNCGKAGSDGSDDAASLLATSPEMKKYKAAPFPFDVNLNQVAYMTCPAVAKNTVAGTEDLDSPFFTVRGGAFDNRPLAVRYPNLFPGVAGMTDEEKAQRLKAGIGLRKEYVDYIRTQFATRLAARPDPVEDLKNLLKKGVQNSSFNARLGSGFIFRQRSANGFAFDGDFIDTKPILEPLSSSLVLDDMLVADVPATGGTQKLSYLDYAEDIANRSFVTSLSLAKSEVHRERVRSAVGFDSQFTIGFTPDDEDMQVFDFMSPEDDNNRSLFGKSYRFTLSSTWPGRVDYDGATAVQTIRKDTDFVAQTTGVTEISTQGLEGTRRFEVDNTELEQQQWECFSLLIVREVDRRNKDGVILDPDVDLSLWTKNAQGAAIKKNKYFDYQAAANMAIVPGVKTACPAQEIGNGTKAGTLNYTGDGGLARMRLELARRFLPAEFWDINTNPEYMCAVPRKTVQGFGQCYSSGDFNGSQYVMYVPGVVQEAGKRVECGINTFTGEVQKECPSYVNICYRKR